MSIYVIACVTVNPDAPQAYARYMEVTAPLLVRAQAKIVQHFAVEDVVVGGKPAESIMIVEYPDLAAMDGLFQSPEYQAVIPVRDRAFTTYNVSIIG